ncbi:MAG: hypothetical protein AAF919_04825 [Pseudomonadota bacterium]
MSNYSIETPSFDSEGLKERAVAALKSMELLRKVFETKIEEFCQRDTTDLKPTELVNIQKELGKAYAIATEQEGKLADALRTEHGGDGLDLAQARAEIGRRLDRIRDAQCSDGVSG